MTEDLFFSATRQHKLRLPSLRVDNSTSGKITHYCFGANSGKMAQDNKTDICFYFCEKPASLRQIKINTPTPHPLNFLVIGCPPNRIIFKRYKKTWFHPHNQQKNKKMAFPLPGRLKWNSPDLSCADQIYPMSDF